MKRMLAFLNTGMIKNGHAQMLKPGGFFIPNYKNKNNNNDNRGPTYNKKRPASTFPFCIA
jgi:hypothetical protein